MADGQAGQVQLEALLPHVGPSAEETQAAYAEAVKELEAAVKTLGFVNLNEESSKSKVDWHNSSRRFIKTSTALVKVRPMWDNC
jgi:hypothetical protein